MRARARRARRERGVERGAVVRGALAAVGLGEVWLTRNAQSLDCRASSSRTARASARAARARRRACAARRRARSRPSPATGGALQVVRSRGVPQDVTGRSGGAGAARGRMAGERVVEPGDRQALPAASPSTAASHSGPSCHQSPISSVSTAKTHRPPRATRWRTRATKSAACSRAAAAPRAGSYGAPSLLHARWRCGVNAW